MENNSIEASVSTQSLIFRSGGNPVSFEVSVSNNSYQFTDFKLEVSAPGENHNPADKWYRLSPDVASAQPHGSTTKFQVIITDTPLPGFVGTVNLTVKVLSPQLRQERRLLVRLEITPGSQSATVNVELPVKQFQAYPRNTVDIPVRVRNIGPQFSELVLRLQGIEPEWCVGGAERRLSLDANTQVEVSFQCEPPSVLQAPSRNYPFHVEVIGQNLADANLDGSLEVLPVGFVELKIDPNRRQLPPGGHWLPNWTAKSTTFDVSFKNGSNVHQQVDVILQGKDAQKCSAHSLPPSASLDLGATTQVDLEIVANRPWVGIGQTLALEAKGVLSDRRLGSTDPATQSLEVRVLPLIPIWMQLAALAVLVAILGWLLKPSAAVHTDLVNTVRFSGDADTIVSGSNDGTIRRWQVLGDKVQPHERAGGVLANPNRATNVLRFMPENNNRVAAGLENGAVELLDVPTATKIDELIDPQLRGDRVFDLTFTQDSKYLFVGHGSGKVRVWNNPVLGGKLQPVAANLLDLNRLGQNSFEVHSLALSPDRHTLAIGGNFKRFILWDWTKNPAKQPTQLIAIQKLEKLDSKLSAGRGDYLWDLAFAPKAPNILATADSDGYVPMWDLA
ncbi:MAG: hypothetical protein LH474_06925, partial [Chamaesiphon sp.]|nr:hypothetical protein [Chamaesiphon sp.]